MPETRAGKGNAVIHRDIVVIGASAGGVEPLRFIAAGLPQGFTGSVFIVLHVPPDHPSQLREILAGVSKLPVCVGADHQEIQPGHIYVATPNHHLLVEDGRVRLSVGPKENRFRPSVDALFRSAALAYGPRVVGVVLSGCLDDGSSGAFAIKERLGTVVVQHPADAGFSAMPMNAMATVEADHVLPAQEIAALLQRLAVTSVQAPEAPPMNKQLDCEVGIALGDNGRMRELMAMGEFTAYTCPECHGALTQIREGHLTRFRCHTGHAFTLSHLLSEVTQANEDAIINALRSLEETELLLVHLQKHLLTGEKTAMAALVGDKITNVRQQAALVKEAAMNNEVMSADTFEKS